MASLKTRRLQVSTGGERVGSATNYTSLDTSGRQTMIGSARVYKDLWLPATQWYGVEPNGFANPFLGPASANTCQATVLPLQVYGGEAQASPIMVPVLAGSNAENLDNRAATTFFAPPDAASAVSPSAFLYWTVASENETTGCMVVWRLHWNYYGTGGSKFGVTSGSVLYGASMATAGSAKLEVSTLGAMGAFTTASPFVVLQLTEEGSNASQMAASAGESVIGLRIRYAVENLGPQVG